MLKDLQSISEKLKHIRRLEEEVVEDDKKI
jgi:hypothetical protein